MMALLELLTSGLGQAIAAAVIAIITGLGIYARGRSSGAQDAKQQTKDLDHAQAKRIEDAADRARRADDAGSDPLGKLRDAGRLRD